MVINSPGRLSFRPVLVFLSGFMLLACGGVTRPAGVQTSAARQRQLADESRKVTKDYLVTKVGVAGFGGKVFCAYKSLGVEESGDEVKEYVYALCQEYSRSGGGVNKGTGLKLPLVLHLRKQGGSYAVLNHQAPRDAGYKREIEQLFPREMQDEIFSLESNSASLEAEAEAEARDYFGTAHD
jgi:hypothetical protein